ncbi:MAG: hypothetical protein KBC17_00035 [Candidatus Pacebacteria bacterium]|nr:hypothetical protein [Candidatus Paceibacterota bacterium]
MKKYIFAGVLAVFLGIITSPSTVSAGDCDIDSPPSITITSPNGGEVFTAGEITTVSWTSCNLTGPSININFVPPDSWTLPFGFATGVVPADTFSTSLNIPPTSLFTPDGLQYGTFYKVRVSDSGDALVTDLSDSEFTINPEATLPAVTTVSATASTSTIEIVGSLTDMGGTDSVSVTFQLSTMPNTDFPIAYSMDPMTSTGTFTTMSGGLACNTLYYFRAVASNTAGTTYGNEMTALTQACPTLPVLTTLTPAYLGSTNAQFLGMLENNTGPVTAHFEYGPTESYGSSVPASTPPFVGGYASLDFSGLTCGTLYHYRIVGTNSVGTGYGNDVTFTTSSCSFGITTGYTAHTEDFYNSYDAVLFGTIHGTPPENVTYGVEWGTTSAYGNLAEDVQVLPDVTNVFGGRARDLICNTEYHYRAFATFDTETVYGDDASFTTYSSPCAPVTLPATLIHSYNAQLNGRFSIVSGVSNTAYFEFGTTTDYGLNVEATLHPDTTDIFITANTSTVLSCNTLYHYRAVVATTGSSFLEYGNDEQFTTLPCSTVETNTASGIAQTSATISGTLTREELYTYYSHFEYGTTIEYGNVTELAVQSTSPVTFTQAISGLTCGALYHYRAQASFTEVTTHYVPNFSTIYGADMTFTTLPCSSGGGGGGIPPPPACDLGKVDANKDCKVDILDFVILMAHWDETGANNIGDFNNDLKVEILDFVLLMAKWTH